MRLSRLAPLLLSAAVLLPVTALALEGIGPRVTVTGTIQEIHISKEQKFKESGAELILLANNGQVVTVVVQDTATIASEGRLSRKLLTPANLSVNMQVRVRGWRVDSKTLTASLVMITNIELNPVLSLSGILQSVQDNKITVLSPDAKTRTLTVTNETQVSVSYDLTGTRGLSLIGKQVLLTLNPVDPTLVRIMRVTGVTEVIRTTPPPTVINENRGY